MRVLRALLPLRRSGIRFTGQFHDTLDQLTGREKKEMLAALAGDCDPFRIMAIRKGPGTWECPNLIPSCQPMRLLACLCHKDDMHLEFMWLHQGCPKRCGCGFWFQLCPVAPFGV